MARHRNEVAREWQVRPHGRLATAFAVWHTEAAKRARLMNGATMRRVAAALRHRRLLPALKRWDVAAARRGNAIQRFGRAVAALRYRWRRAAFNSWLEMAMTRRIALALLRRAAAALRHRQLRSALNKLLGARVAGGRRAALMRRGRAHVCVAQLLRVQRRLDWLSGESWLRRGGAPVRAAQALLAMYGRQAARLKVALEDPSAVALLPATFGAFERLRLRALCAAAVRSLRCRAAFGYWQSFAQAKSWMGTFVRESMRGRAAERRNSERQRWLDEVTAAEARWLGAEAKLMARQSFASVTAAEARWLDKVAAGAAKEEPALLSTLKVTTRPPTRPPARRPPRPHSPLFPCSLHHSSSNRSPCPPLLHSSLRRRTTWPGCPWRRRRMRSRPTSTTSKWRAPTWWRRSSPTLSARWRRC